MLVMVYVTISGRTSFYSENSFFFIKLQKTNLSLCLPKKGSESAYTDMVMLAKKQQLPHC